MFGSLSYTSSPAAHAGRVPDRGKGSGGGIEYAAAYLFGQTDRAL